jgi:hypothetical protein
MKVYHRSNLIRTHYDELRSSFSNHTATKFGQLHRFPTCINIPGSVAPLLIFTPKTNSPNQIKSYALFPRSAVNLPLLVHLLINALGSGAGECLDLDKLVSVLPLACFMARHPLWRTLKRSASSQKQSSILRLRNTHTYICKSCLNIW